MVDPPRPGYGRRSWVWALLPQWCYLTLWVGEVVRLEAVFQTFHTQGIFRYVLERAYEQQPSFQRYLSLHADHLREQGYDVDIWSYDRPVSRDGIAIVPD